VDFSCKCRGLLEHLTGLGRANSLPECRTLASASPRQRSLIITKLKRILNNMIIDNVQTFLSEALHLYHTSSGVVIVHSDKTDVHD